jgi:hypothetical protein
VNSDRVEGALKELGAEDRALVELSVVRGVSDDEIASLLGTDPDTVRSRRDAAIGDLAAAAGDSSEVGQATTVDHLRSSGRAAGSAATAEAAGPERSRRLTLALLGGLAIALAVALVLALSGGDEPEPSSSEGAAARLLPIAGGAPLGTVRVEGSGDSARLRLRVRGLPAPPKGGYVVWLYNSVSDARSLGGGLRGTFSLDSPLPRDWSRYQSVDISRERADGNRNHSGQSVVRAPLAPLAQ